MSRKVILFEDIDEGPQWVATFHMAADEFDDSFDETNSTEILFNASDFDTAVRYAQQYLRKMQTEEETSEEWASAEIVSVELR